VTVSPCVSMRCWMPSTASSSVTVPGDPEENVRVTSMVSPISTAATAFFCAVVNEPKNVETPEKRGSGAPTRR